MDVEKVLHEFEDVEELVEEIRVILSMMSNVSEAFTDPKDTKSLMASVRYLKKYSESLLVDVKECDEEIEERFKDSGEIFQYTLRRFIE